MDLILDGLNLSQAESERYWSFPSNYSKERKQQEVKNFIFSSEYLGSRKYDGAYYRLIKNLDGDIYLQGRSRGVKGTFSEKSEWVPHLIGFFNELPKGTCLLGEIYTPQNEISSNVTKVMGCGKEKAIKRQENPDLKLYYHVFDIWALGGISFMKKPAHCRFSHLSKLPKHPYVTVAKYLRGGKLWEELGLILECGGEGIVMTHQDSFPGPGDRTARKTLKIKKEISDTIDCIIMGVNPPTEEYTGNSPETWSYWKNLVTGERINEKLYREAYAGEPLIPITKNYYSGWAGSFKIGLMKEGRLTQIGSLSGVTDEMLANWKEYIGKVIEISAMEILPTGGLRHPRFVQLRPDKTPEACLWEDYFE